MYFFYYSSNFPLILGQHHPSHINVICLIELNGLKYQMVLINLKKILLSVSLEFRAVIVLSITSTMTYSVE